MPWSYLFVLVNSKESVIGINSIVKLWLEGAITNPGKKRINGILTFIPPPFSRNAPLVHLSYRHLSFYAVSYNTYVLSTIRRYFLALMKFSSIQNSRDWHLARTA